MRGSIPPFLVAVLLALMGAPALAMSSASVEDVSLAGVAYSHAAQNNGGTLFLNAVNDGATGFNVTIQSSDFQYAGPHSGTPIAAANFALLSVAEPEVTSGQPIDPVAGPRVPAGGVAGALDVPRKTLQADAGFGVGSYRQALNVSLTIPGQAKAGTYTATLTTTIGAGP